MSTLSIGDFEVDSSVAGHDGRYTATLSECWEIWGPQGGYVAAVALRAAGQESAFPRPASFACHFLRTPAFGPVEIHVETLRKGKRAESLHVGVVQDDATVVEGLLWTVADLVGLDHRGVTMPDVPPAEEVELSGPDLPGGYPAPSFFGNFELRSVSVHQSEWETEPRDPTWLLWARLRKRPPVEDPFVDAGRMLMGVDFTMFPAATLAHGNALPYVAPSLDLAMSFHSDEPGSDWLLIEASSPLSAHALVAGRASIWSADGRLLGSAMQQMLQRA